MCSTRRVRDMIKIGRRLRRVRHWGPSRKSSTTAWAGLRQVDAAWVRGEPYEQNLSAPGAFMLQVGHRRAGAPLELAPALSRMRATRRSPKGTRDDDSRRPGQGRSRGGGARGTGRAIAERFAELGPDVRLTGRDRAGPPRSPSHSPRPTRPRSAGTHSTSRTGPVYGRWSRSSAHSTAALTC